MTRLLLTFLVVTAAEIYAFLVFRSHPISQPAYFPALLTVIQFLMCYGGVEGARWLLRRSPAATSPGPESDWARLWLWLGPPGGLLMVVSSLLAQAAASQTSSLVAPAILLGHAAGGGILWLLASLEMLPALARIKSSARAFNGALAAGGLATHLAGIYCYAQVYPAGQLKLGLLAVGVLLTYFIFYYIWLGCLAWALMFRFWTPPQEIPQRNQS